MTKCDRTGYGSCSHLQHAIYVLCESHQHHQQLGMLPCETVVSGLHIYLTSRMLLGCVASKLQLGCVDIHLLHCVWLNAHVASVFTGDCSSSSS